MTEVLIQTSVYGILALGLINLYVAYKSYRRELIVYSDLIWITLGIIGVSFIATSIMLKGTLKLNWMYYVALTACGFGMIGLFLKLTQQLLRNR
ncbi:MAG: hypothetical protein R2780_03120 [Crocinitomicaceae bacterium]|nr:hypothetical protein [Crocinitomicaceae bacterium]